MVSYAYSYMTGYLHELSDFVSKGLGCADCGLLPEAQVWYSIAQRRRDEIRQVIDNRYGLDAARHWKNISDAKMAPLLNCLKKNSTRQKVQTSK